MVNKKSAENNWEICKKILYLQRKTRLVANQLGADGMAGAGVSIAEGLLLNILFGDANKTVKDLAEILKLERSWVSRLVSALEEKKLTDSTESPLDKRAKFVSITKKGEKVLEELNTFRYQVMQQAISDLPSGSQNEFARLIRKVADSLNAYKFFITPQSHLIDPHMARIYMAIGVMGENFLNCGIGVAQFHIFETIASAKNNTMLASDVNDLLPFDMSTITRSIVNFEKAGIFLRQTAAHDKRSVFVSLSKKGDEVWNNFKKRAGEIFAAVTEQLSQPELARLLEIFDNIVSNMPIAKSGSIRGNIEIKEINTSDLMKQARTFSEVNIFSPKLLGEEKSRSKYLLYSGNEICGIASIEHKGKSAKEDKFTIALSGLNDKECNAFLKQLSRWRRRQPRI